jgi:hypothetical protein
MRKAAIAVGLGLGLFLIVRAVAEPFVIDVSNPATYRNDWGGPGLLGVLPGALRTRRHRGRRHHHGPDPSSPLRQRPDPVSWRAVA